MKAFWILTLCLAVAALCAPGCSKKGGGEGEGEGGEPAAAKVDLSSAKASFESFTGKLDEVKKFADKEMGDIFMPVDHETYKTVFTTDYIGHLKEQAKSERRSSGEEGKLVFSKEEAGEGGEVIIHATQTNKKADKSEEVRNHKLHFAKEGEEWRIKNWYKMCPSCDGKGLCPECEGTGKTLPKECYSCKGSGKSKSGGKCYACDGTGKTKVRDCMRCKETEGKCSFCKGEGWRREDEFEGGGFLVKLDKTQEKHFDLSTPENAAKTFVNLGELQKVGILKTLKRLTTMVEETVNSYFVKETQAKFQENLKKSAAKFKEKEDATKQTVGTPETQGDVSVVIITETTTRRGKTREEKKALKIIKQGSVWKIDDRGRGCWTCKATGVCGQCGGTGTTLPKECWSCKGTGKGKDGKDCFTCKGTGKTKPQECYSCKKTEGKCAQCKGEKYSWERAKKK